MVTPTTTSILPLETLCSRSRKSLNSAPSPLWHQVLQSLVCSTCESAYTLTHSKRIAKTELADSIRARKSSCEACSLSWHCDSIAGAAASTGSWYGLLPITASRRLGPFFSLKTIRIKPRSCVQQFIYRYVPIPAHMASECC